MNGGGAAGATAGFGAALLLVCSRMMSGGLATQHRIAGSALDVQIVGHRPQAYLVAAVDRFVVIFSAQSPTLQSAAAYARAVELVGQRHGRMGHLIFMKQFTSLPAPEARGAVAEVLRKHERDIVAVAIVHEGDGWRSAVVRTVISTVQLASGTTHPTKVFSSLGVAGVWLEAQVSPKHSPASLGQNLHSLRGRFDRG